MEEKLSNEDMDISRGEAQDRGMGVGRYYYIYLLPLSVSCAPYMSKPIR